MSTTFTGTGWQIVVENNGEFVLTRFASDGQDQLTENCNVFKMDASDFRIWLTHHLNLDVVELTHALNALV